MVNSCFTGLPCIFLKICPFLEIKKGLNIHCVRETQEAHARHVAMHSSSAASLAGLALTVLHAFELQTFPHPPEGYPSAPHFIAAYSEVMLGVLACV